MRPEDRIEHALARLAPGPARFLLGLSTGPDGRYRHAWKWSLVLFLLYLAGFVVLPTFSPTAYFGGDTWEYQSMAVNLAKGHGLKIGAVEPLEAYAFNQPETKPDRLARFMAHGVAGGSDDFYRTPGYPLLLGLFYKAFGVRPDLAKRVQVAMLVFIAALLPLMGNALAGRRGFHSGLVAGLLFLAMKHYMARAIMTEALMALSSLLVLWLWLFWNRRKESNARAAAAGLSLTALLMVKGAFVFLPPLLAGYVFLRSYLGKAYPLRAFWTFTLCFGLTLAPWSIYVSYKTGSLVILTTQSRNMLLDGNNELTLERGKWNREWRDNPDSFYNRIIKETGNDSTNFLLGKFLSAHWKSIPWMVRNKLHSGFHKDFMMEVWAILLLLLAAAAPWRDRYRVMLWSLGAWSMAYLFLALWLRSLFVTGLALFPAAGLFALAFRPGRRMLAAAWNNPFLVWSVSVILNFLLIMVMTFGDLRFTMPLTFLFYSLTVYQLLALADMLTPPAKPAPAAPREQEKEGQTEPQGEAEGEKPEGEKQPSEAAQGGTPEPEPQPA